MTQLVVGLDIGTSSSKVVAVDASGQVVAQARAVHGVDTPRPGWVEQDAEQTWWSEPASLLRTVCDQLGPRKSKIVAIAVSGLGPCLVPCDADFRPLRPAILYGIDTRATDEITTLEAEFGAAAILDRCGSALSSQAIGPKLLWLRRNEPLVWSRTARWLSASSFLVARLTGEYVLDHHTASQCDPIYDLRTGDWAYDWAEWICAGVPLPRLVWSDQVCGAVLAEAAEATGLPVGTPVLGGTVDAWAEAHSVGVRRTGDLMLMYGSTMFMVGFADGSASHPGLWRTAGVSPGVRTMAAGMATSGLLTSWLADLVGHPVGELSAAAADLAPGCDGLVILPYFAGERSPRFDPGARGVVLGLNLSHTPVHLMRAALESVAFGVRHNLAAFEEVGGAQPWRLVGVGGGAGGLVWPQIVADVTGRTQIVPEQTIGACYGDALLAATALELVPPDTDWTQVSDVIEPRPEYAARYDDLFDVYLSLYPATRPLLTRLISSSTDSPMQTVGRHM